MKKIDSIKTDEEIIKSILEKSGNSFHARVVEKLREYGWDVLVSPYYNDNYTDKPREIDIIAEREFGVDHPHYGYSGKMKVRLFIECKYIADKTVFWFDSKDKSKSSKRIQQDTSLTETEININSHHYYDDKPVAKLFASDKNRTEENDSINKAINQSLNATVYYRHRWDLKIKSDKEKPGKLLETVYYPIILVNSFDNFYATDMSNPKGVEKIKDPFQIEVNYAYMDKDKKPCNEYFLIDVVNIEGLLVFFQDSIENKDIVYISEKLGRMEYEHRTNNIINGRGGDNFFGQY